MATKSIGQRMTSQRKLLLDIIRHAKGHLDADEIYRLSREKDAHISLSTVYRNLNLLKEAGLVLERHLGEDHHYYELNVRPMHHHLVCVECGEVFEFKCEFTEQMKREVEKTSHFRITGVEVEMRGYCPKCQEKMLNG
ncbi:MAG: Fur family transcriptional regulator [Dehalococcoidia bacterium]